MDAQPGDPARRQAGGGMSVTAASLLDAASAEPPGEFTIRWGEDTNCTSCGYFLAAGSPAWPDEDGRALCLTCTEREG
jgi:hypothetical protein